MEAVARVLMPEDWAIVTDMAATVKTMAKKIEAMEKKQNWKDSGKGEYMKKGEVCERLHLSLSKLYTLTKEGVIKSYSFDGRKEKLYRREEIEEYADKINEQ